MKRTKLSFNEFEEKFLQATTPIVRVTLNHSLLRQNANDGHIRVSTRNNISPSELVSEFLLYAPWHVHVETDLPVMPSSDTRPILLNKIKAEEEFIRVHHLAHIDNIREWFQSIEHSTDPTNIDIVTLKLGRKRLFVLDGNHRLSALIHELESGHIPNVTITEYRIKSKLLSTELLPDIETLLNKDH